MEKERLYAELKEVCLNAAPDDTEEVEDFEEIDSLNPGTNSEYEDAIKLLAHFLGDWFPYDEDEETIKYYHYLLEQASFIR